MAAPDGTKADTAGVEDHKGSRAAYSPPRCSTPSAPPSGGQNGAATKYAPAVMAATILALQWDAGLKVRALLLENGMLAFNYLEGCRSAIGGKVSQSFVVDENGHASADARPWKDVRTEVRTVYPHSSLKAVC